MLVLGNKVHTRSIDPGQAHEYQGDEHGKRVIESMAPFPEVVGGRTSSRRDTCTANDTANDETAAALGVSAQSAHSQGHNGGEADGLEEQDDVEHRHASVAALRDGRDEEDDNAADEDEKHPSWTDVLHDAYASKPAECKRRLRTGKELGGVRVGSAGTSVHGVVDEKAGNGNLRASVAELGKRGVEQLPLLPKRLDGGATNVRFLCLEFHICHVSVSSLPRSPATAAAAAEATAAEATAVAGERASLEEHTSIRDFGNIREKEDRREKQYKNGNRKINPLDIGHGTIVAKVEEDV